jgi:hypothetical protein
VAVGTFRKFFLVPVGQPYIKYLIPLPLYVRGEPDFLKVVMDFKIQRKGRVGKGRVGKGRG